MRTPAIRFETTAQGRVIRLTTCYRCGADVVVKNANKQHYFCLVCKKKRG